MATRSTNRQDGEPRIKLRGIRQLLLDIEGTTCPVSYVAEVLFPYASRALGEFLEEAGGQREVRLLVESVEATWRQDGDPEAQRLLQQNPDAPAAYLRWLIQQDRKLPALKELQGLVWQAGYSSGELVAPLFGDVAENLRRWRQQGLRLAVYSSGSVTAQQLLYRHSNDGDLSRLFEHWFDTKTGPKNQASSYRKIADELRLEPFEILFISDSIAECHAAQEAGTTVLFSDRDRNPNRDPHGLPAIRNFSQLIILAPEATAEAKGQDRASG